METSKSRTVAFTGHRSRRITTATTALAREVERAITDLYFKGYRHFMSGMSEGFDLLTAEAVLKLRKLHTDVKLTAVIPFTGQARHYSEEDKKRYGTIFQQCDKSVLIADQYFTGCFHRRNDYLLDNASFVVAYFDGTAKGGTCYTVNKAKEIKTPVSNLMDNIAANQWWENAARDVKALFSAVDNNTAWDDHYRMFWKKLAQPDKNNIHQYWQHRAGKIELSEDEANSLQMEIICELADIALEAELGKPSEDMCDEEGSFYEEYQDRFNDLYDDMEDRIVNHDFITE